MGVAITVRSVLFRMSIVNNDNILRIRGLACRLESLGLKITNEPSCRSTFVDGNLAELIKRSASDWLGDLAP